jgi:hypothetical protein
MELVKRRNERRSKYRFTMQRELRYKATRDGVQAVSGTGRTLNLCSGGVAFTTDHPVHDGAFIELSIDWPALLDDSCPMRLIAFGRVLRANGLTVACSIDKYEFRTAGRIFHSVAATRTDSMLQRFADGVRKETQKVGLVGA